MSRADLLERARALLVLSRSGDEGDRRDETGPDEGPSVANIASVATPIDDDDGELETFQAVLDAYVDGAAVPAVRAAFAAWTVAAGLTFANQSGVVVARDATGRVVAAADTTGPRAFKRRPIPKVPCWTCGAAPVGTFEDGSPRYACRHDPESTA